MGLFRYKAARRDGQVIEGTLEAADPAGVARILQTQGSLPLHIAAASAQSSPARPATRGRPKAKAGHATIDAFTLQLSTLLNAGLPLAQALEILGEVATDDGLAALAQAVNQGVRNGESLSQALADSGAGFDDFYRNMVRAGESSGALGLALDRLAAFRAARREMRHALISALIYPAILLVLAIIAVAVLLAFVVPQFTALFADAGRDLPLLTRLVAGAGELVTRWWWAMLLTGGGLGWWLYQDWQSPIGRARWDRLLLNTPLIGGLIAELNTARFARTLSSLLENGVTLVPALAIAREIIANTQMAQAVADITRRVREGEGLALALAEAGVFPPLAAQLIRVGEQTGRLEPMLAKLADIYEHDVQASLRRLLTLAEPAIVISMALLITLIILSVVLMILESNSLAF